MLFSCYVQITKEADLLLVNLGIHAKLYYSTSYLKKMILKSCMDNTPWKALLSVPVNKTLMLNLKPVENKCIFLILIPSLEKSNQLPLAIKTSWNKSLKVILECQSHLSNAPLLLNFCLLFGTPDSDKAHLLASVSLEQSIFRVMFIRMYL